VVPAHNAEVTLARALDCLLDQKIVDWEAIIVDDASTDRTAAIIAGYVEHDARFRTLSACAYSAAGARNSGISTARGHWLMFLDADDWVDASFLAKMLAALKTAPDAVAAYCGSRRVMPDGELTPVEHHSELAIQPFETFVCRCAIRTHALLATGRQLSSGGFDPSPRTCEDWDLWQRLARLGKNWVMATSRWLHRASPNSLTRNATQMLADAETVITRGFLRIQGSNTRHQHTPMERFRRTAALPEALAWLRCGTPRRIGGGGSCRSTRSPVGAPGRTEVRAPGGL
jgi:hypothetical protein